MAKLKLTYKGMILSFPFMLSLLGCLSLTSLYRPLNAQQLQFLRSFPLKQEISLASADTQGHLFMATRDAEIQKLSPDGELLNVYSPQAASHFTALQARSTMQIMAFDENNQQLIFLDRFLNLASSIQIPARELGYVSALTWTPGNSIWVVDANAGQLRQWRFDTRQLLLSLNLNQLIPDAVNLDIQDLREYQHKLYLFTAAQVYVFDQLGNYERQFSIKKPIKAIAFMGDQVFGLHDEQLISIDLYSGERQEFPLPAKKNYQQLLFSKGELYLFSRRQADIYRPMP